MIRARWAVRAGAAVLALVVLGGCAHRPAHYGRVEPGYGPYGGQVAPAGYDSAPVYSPRARDRYDRDGYDRYDRYGRPHRGQPEGYGYGRGYPAPQHEGYDRYGYGQQVGVEFGRVHHIEALSGYRANSGGGALLGGIIGGLVGRQFGNSSTGRAQGTFAGAVGGVLIGNEIERQNRGGRDGLLVVIALEQGGTREFAVPSVGDLRVGDRVRIEGGNRLLRM
jgi:outer membrane lipoprotein SlyB